MSPKTARATGPAFAISRWWIVPFSLSLLAGTGSLVGCHRAKTEKTEAAPANDSAKQSLDGLKTRLDALNVKFSALGKQIEGVPPDLPGFGELRAKYYAVEEGKGIMGPKIASLSDRLDSAR